MADLGILTTEHARIPPDGPMVVVMEAGRMLYPDTATDAESRAAYRAALEALVATHGAQTYKVLSLEGRPAVDVLLQRSPATGSYNLTYDGQTVEIEVSSPPVTRWGGRRFVVRRKGPAAPCLDGTVDNTRLDQPSIDCMFNPRTNLLMADTSVASFRLAELVDNGTPCRLELAGVLPPSVASRDRLEAEVEADVFGPAFGGRTLVPWADSSSPPNDMLRSHVAAIQSFWKATAASDLVVVRCSMGLGRSGVAMLIGYLVYNPTASVDQLYEWFYQAHEDPDEAWTMYEEAPLNHYVHAPVVTAAFVDLAV